MLIWGKHPTFNTSTFKVYRSLSSDPNGKYKIIASIDQKDFYYQDLATDYYEDPPKYYYVKAYNGSYSGRTNIGSTLISKSLQKNVKSAEKQLIVNKNYISINYPNPFNPSTNITFQVAKKGHVVLKVYNTLGKEVAELVNETKEEGTHLVTFNGDNLPSGMYFYKIQSGEFVDVKKMLLLK